MKNFPVDKIVNCCISSVAKVLLNFLVTVKAAPHECVNSTGLL